MKVRIYVNLRVLHNLRAKKRKECNSDLRDLQEPLPDPKTDCSFNRRPTWIPLQNSSSEDGAAPALRSIGIHWSRTVKNAMTTEAPSPTDWDCRAWLSSFACPSLSVRCSNAE
jgi:hypothetical protein